MKHTHRAWVLMLGGLCAATVLMTSCNTQKPDAETESGTPESTAPAEMTCKVSLFEADGKALTNVVLKIQKDGADVATKMVGATGTIELSLASADYTITLTSPDGAKLYYDEKDAVITPETPEKSITVFRGASETYPMDAPSKKSLDGSYVPFDAPLVAEGTTYIEFSKDDYTYIIFAPTRAGVFEFTATEGAEITYHGAAAMVWDEPRISPKDGVISLPVEATSLGGASVSQLVFRIKPTESSDATGAAFTATRTGDIIKSDEELATWITYEASKSALDALSTFKEPLEGDKWATLTSGTLTDLNLKSAGLTVVLGSDGYYHLGTADGPMVFIRMTSDSAYVEDFVKMCETDHLRCYFYDENGKFLRKEGYNSLINAYGELANADGVVPLNEEIAYAIQNIGNHMGWWNYEQNSDIFGDEVFPVSVAWLFACATYQ